MNVTVFGFTGAIGSLTVAELLDRGHTISAYARNTAKIPSIWGDRVRLHQSRGHRRVHRGPGRRRHVPTPRPCRQQRKGRIDRSCLTAPRSSTVWRVPSRKEIMSDTFNPAISVPMHDPSRRSETPVRRVLGWIVVAAAAAAAVIVPLTGAPAAAQTISLLGVALALVVSSIWENLSVMTGFPFGNYHYTLTPQLFYVPVFIGFAYFGIGFVSWMTANTILDRADEQLDLRTRAGRINAFALPLLAGAVMTMFDVGIDPISSTVRNAWVWEEGGGVFGVPFTNYLGWWFVTWSFFQLFALVLAVRQTRRATGQAVGLPPISHLQPVLLYLMFGVSSITAFLGFTDAETVVDMTGMTWSTPAIFETLMVVILFSIVPVSLFAITKIARGDLRRG